uniref:Talin-1 n=1 Tax=Magallana gigas TaxID=29159 RepID=K1QJA4_MAGGI
MVTICTKMGISNHEEYSLVREMMDDEKEETLTLRRDKSIAKDQKKLDEMRKKLHTDDELEWLDHSRTLRKQGVLDVDTLLLRRKFFFSDQNVDQRELLPGEEPRMIFGDEDHLRGEECDGQTGSNTSAR